MRFLPFALFLLSATPNLFVAGVTCACGSTCTCKHDTEAVLKEREKIRKELASFYDAYWHGQDVNIWRRSIDPLLAVSLPASLPHYPSAQSRKTNDLDSLPDQKYGKPTAASFASLELFGKN
jgi:hypothetical protein